jgi:hypothetical protein
MPYIKTKNAMFQEDDVIAVEYDPFVSIKEKAMTVHLRSGGQIRIGDKDEASRIWEHFTDKLGDLSIRIDVPETAS